MQSDGAGTYTRELMVQSTSRGFALIEVADSEVLLGLYLAFGKTVFFSVVFLASCLSRASDNSRYLIGLGCLCVGFPSCQFLCWIF